MSGQLLVQTEHLSRRFGETLAVDNINLQLRKGDVLGLLGVNGAGKTTTLRMLAGCLAPTTGRIRINGIDMNENPRSAKLALGYLPEHPPVYRELTVVEFLHYCAALRAMPPAKREGAITSAIADCGLGNVTGKVIGNLSKGYQQRVGIAQAILHRPPLIILDEATVGLDPNQILEIRDLISRLARQHSIILSSHILSEIQATCNRVCIIHNGGIVFADSLENIRTLGIPTVLTIGMRHPPDVDTMAGLPGITKARDLGNGLFRLECRKGPDPRDALAKHAMQRGWGLYELHGQEKSLEEIFVDLTTRDWAHPE